MKSKELIALLSRILKYKPMSVRISKKEIVVKIKGTEKLDDLIDEVENFSLEELHYENDIVRLIFRKAVKIKKEISKELEEE